LGIETTSAAVGDAWENARMNGIENAFAEGDVKVLRRWPMEAASCRNRSGRPDVIVVDRPGPG
jgi:tRNA/tmRNA/rRNA uracil-C5-methylase (TrmA/RlmC/RlmD family)